MKFLHTMLRVKNIEKSLDFYQNIIGLNIHHTLDLEDCKLYFLSDNEGYTQIELTYNFDTPKNGYKLGENFGHLAFKVENFEEVSDKLKKSNLKYMYEPFPLANMEIAFIKDPDGNEIELIKE